MAAELTSEGTCAIARSTSLAALSICDLSLPLPRPFLKRTISGLTSLFPSLTSGIVSLNCGGEAMP